jgi:AcrR family transcriptional regulator
MSTSNRSSYHHGALRPALIAAARALLDEGGPDAVGLREAARRVGVSATATYRHFKDKEALLAALAVEGFREFGAALAATQSDPNPLSTMGAAYVDFALAKPGMFRLMFSPMLSARRGDEELHAAANAAFATLARGVGARAETPPTTEIPPAAIAAWSLVHGLSHLILDGVLPRSEAETFKRAILAPPAGEQSARGQRRPDMAEEPR